MPMDKVFHKHRYTQIGQIYNNINCFFNLGNLEVLISCCVTHPNTQILLRCDEIHNFAFTCHSSTPLQSIDSLKKVGFSCPLFGLSSVMGKETRRVLGEKH